MSVLSEVLSSLASATFWTKRKRPAVGYYIPDCRLYNLFYNFFRIIFPQIC